MSTTQELNRVADQLITASLNWVDEEVPTELICTTPLFSHSMREGYEFDYDERYGFVVVEWMPEVRDGGCHTHCWEATQVEKWLRNLALATEQDASDETVQTLSQLVVDKLTALGGCNG